MTASVAFLHSSGYLGFVVFKGVLAVPFVVISLLIRAVDRRFGINPVAGFILTIICTAFFVAFGHPVENNIVLILERVWR
jgi:hypothetical protein